MPSAPRALSESQVLRLRTGAQALLSRRSGGRRPSHQVALVVRHLCGVQAQDAAAAALSVRVRCAGLRAADVERARVDERAVVRTWLMRGTLHLAAAEDIGWLLGLLAPVFVRGGRGRRAELGLDEETGRRGVRALRDVLAGCGPLTRAELAARLAARGIHTVGQATIHLIGLAALEGIVCLGPERAGKPTYVLLSDWIDPGKPLPEERAMAELARRYLAAYGPAAPEDFAAWSGLTLGQARTAWQQIAPYLAEVRLNAASLWLLKSAVARLDRPGDRTAVVRLLPAFDTYWMGYRGRALALAPQHARRILPGGGLIHPALLVDGRARGRWRLERGRQGLTLGLEPFQPLSAAVRRGLALELKDLAHFLGVEGPVLSAVEGLQVRC